MGRGKRRVGEHVDSTVRDYYRWEVASVQVPEPPELSGISGLCRFRTGRATLAKAVFAAATLAAVFALAFAGRMRSPLAEALNDARNRFDVDGKLTAFFIEAGDTYRKGLSKGEEL